jgi:hypothetical protein
MYLAEAIKEKDFIEESINQLCDRIKELSVSTDDADVKLNKEFVKNKVKELENLYKESQRYSIIVDRAKVVSKIKLNDDEFSIADAENILESMRDKLDFFNVIKYHIEKYNLISQTFVCIDLEEIHAKIKGIMSDIRTIENSIERTLWNTEV